jgi:adenosine kinase
MRTLICGSLAFDTIMVFRDRFARHILPEQSHVLSVSFQIADMRREWGGCAGNIAYNLRALGIAADGVRVIDDAYTAQAYIITDLDDNQITAFHPGAMNLSQVNRVGDVADVGLGIVAPDGKQGMQAHAAQFAGAGIPFLFDPGQGLPLFAGDELTEIIDQASFLAVNDYEAKLLCERTGLSISGLAELVDALIVTLGAEGSIIHAEGATFSIPAVTPTAVVDPTGCGDAYRAGLLYGVAQGWDWQSTGNLASVMGSIKIASRGGQNHVVSREIVAQRYYEAFGERPW